MKRTGNQGDTTLNNSLNLVAKNEQNVELRFLVITNTFQTDEAIDDDKTMQAIEICDNGIDDDGNIDCAESEC